MNRSRFVLAAVFLMAACLIVPIVQIAGADEKEPTDVAAQVKLLRERVAKLEARITELEKKPTYVTVREGSLAPPLRGAVPKGWQEREFNGMTYYIVPLETRR